MYALLSSAVLTSLVLTMACTVQVGPNGGGGEQVDGGSERADNQGESPDAGLPPDAAPIFDACELARVDDDLTNGLLASFIPTAFPDVWLLGTDAQSEGLWTWGGTEALTFAKWRTGEPNNGGGGTPENCMIMQSNQGGVWDDRPCTQQLSYLCQR